MAALVPVDDLVRAAIALRCEHTLKALFPPPAANSMDSLLEMQRGAAKRNHVGDGRGHDPQLAEGARQAMGGEGGRGHG